VHYLQGDLTSARARCEESVTILREGGNAWALSNALITLAHIARDLGDDALEGADQGVEFRSEEPGDDV
jgi:hypothetical protein